MRLIAAQHSADSNSDHLAYSTVAQLSITADGRFILSDEMSDEVKH